MKGVIIAAGYGVRLHPLTLDIPKVLLEIGGRQLIHYPLNALSSAGLSEIAVVVGYRAEKIMEALNGTHPNLRFIHNEHYDGDNALSLYAARFFLEDGPFVVCMGDHPITSGIIHRLLSKNRGGCVLCVDLEACHPSQIRDATRVLVDAAGNIVAIAKELKVWNAIDTGVFMMNGDVFPAIENLMERQGVRVGISDVVNYMRGSDTPFATCDVSGMFWADVDTLEDYQSVDSLLKENHGECV